MKVLLMAAVIALLATSAMAGPFTNGDFESPTVTTKTSYVVPTGWTTYANGNGNPMMEYQPVTAPGPVQYVQMQALIANFYGGYKQTFDAVPGATYTIQGWFRPLAGDVTTQVAVDPTGGDTRPSVWNASLYGGTSQVWTYFTFQVQAQASSMTIWLDVLSPRSAKAGAFDKIMIPEPGSMVALLSGLLGLGAVVRRRK